MLNPLIRNPQQEAEIESQEYSVFNHIELLKKYTSEMTDRLRLHGNMESNIGHDDIYWFLKIKYAWVKDRFNR